MKDLKTFKEQVNYYLSLAEIESSNKRDYDERRGMTQGDLADACGINRSDFNRKLNGKIPISSIQVKRIVVELAKHYGITTKSQAKELLTLMGVPDFSPAEWNAHPLNLLEEETSENDKRIVVSDPDIPRFFEHFLGREELVQQLIKQLCGSGNIKPMALYGDPGVGKTAIAMAIANDSTVQQYFHNRLLWAGLGKNPDIEGIQHRWSSLLHIHDIEAEIGSQPMLLILDDVWDINHVTTFFRFGNHNPFRRFLITTVYKQLADNISENYSVIIPELTPEKGLELLLLLAPNIAQAEKNDAHALIEAVGSLPLAIWLMGTYLESQANSKQPRRIQDALKRLQDYEERIHLTRFAHDSRAFPSIKGMSTISLEAVIGVRYEALDDRSRKMLRALSIFQPKPNTFSEDAASAVVGTASGKEFRDQLVDAGFVGDVGGDRYSLHQTIHDFALLRLNKEHGESQAANERLADFFVDYVKLNAIQSFDETNINHALQWAHDQGQDELYLALESGMQYFWRDHWRVDESMEHLHKGFSTAITMYKETKDPKRLQSMMEIACNYGSTLLVANRLDETKQVFETILEIARSDTPDRLSEGIALFNLGVVDLQQGSLVKAWEKFDKSLIIRKETQYQDEWALDFNTFCRIAQGRRHLKTLKDYFEQAVQIDRGRKNRRGEGVNLFSLGNIALIQKNYKAAATNYQRCLSIVNEFQEMIDFQESIKEGMVLSRWRDTILLARCNVLSQLCETSLYLGNIDEAKDYRQQCLIIIQKLNHLRNLAGHHLYSGHLALANEQNKQATNQQKEKAIWYYQQAQMVAQEVQDLAIVAEVRYSLGKLAELERKLKNAERLYRESLELSQAIENAPRIATSQLQLGQVLLKLGKNREGCSTISEAIQWYSAMGLKDDEIAAKEIVKQYNC